MLWWRRVVHGAHGFSQPLLTLLHLTACYAEQNATINFCLANNDVRQIANSNNTKQILNFQFKLMCVSLIVQYISAIVWKHSRSHVDWQNWRRTGNIHWQDSPIKITVSSQSTDRPCMLAVQPNSRAAWVNCHVQLCTHPVNDLMGCLYSVLCVSTNKTSAEN